MKRMLAGILVGGLIAIATRSANAQTVDTARAKQPDPALIAPPMIEAGRKLFHGSGTCHACHGEKLQGGPVAPALTGPHWRHITGTFDAIVDRIEHGNPGTIMVPHPGGITESQVLLVAAYVYAVSHGIARP
jgi:mono/diheme cytochrome c family protein